MYIFRLNISESRNNHFCSDFYYMKIWEGEILVRDLVPVVKTEEVVALLDMVTGALYENLLKGEGIIYTE